MKAIIWWLQQQTNIHKNQSNVKNINLVKLTTIKTISSSYDMENTGKPDKLFSSTPIQFHLVVFRHKESTKVRL